MEFPRRKILASAAAMAWLELAFIPIGCGTRGFEGPVSTVIRPIKVPPRVSLGVLAPGETRSARFKVRNQSDRQISLTIETDCPCLSFKPRECSVPARGIVSIEVCHEPAAEPEFRGSLAVETRGVDDRKNEQFRMLVELEIK